MLKIIEKLPGTTTPGNQNLALEGQVAIETLVQALSPKKHIDSSNTTTGKKYPKLYRTLYRLGSRLST